MLIFPTIKLAFNCPCALQPFSGGAILFLGRTIRADFNASGESAISFCIKSPHRHILILIKLTPQIRSHPVDFQTWRLN